MSNSNKAPVLLELYHQIVSRHIQDTRWGGLTPLQGCNRCVLQPQAIGQLNMEAKVPSLKLRTETNSLN